MKLFLPLLLLFIIPLSSFSQAVTPVRPTIPVQMNMGNIYGKIVDAVSQKSIEAATIVLVQNKLDTLTKKKKDFVVATQLTDKKGDFNINALPVMGTFRFLVSAIGYKSYEEKISFEVNKNGGKPGDMSSMMNASVKDLGNIKLTPDEQQLQNVTVTASKPMLQMFLDKKVYNVEKDISATGGTAVDVMKNIPSVNVDIDGNVSLRNASPQIFIDGRPTTLTLDQIPADNIASVEIITNPSAKFDASGGGAGILNIVLKKNRKAGYNGNLRTSIDSRGRPGFGGDINIKQQKINFFLAGMLNTRKSISTINTNRTDFLNDKTLELMQQNGPITRGLFAFGRGGMDYFLDNRNTLTISGSLFKGEFKSTDLLSLQRDTISNTGTSSESATRGMNAINKFNSNGLRVGFKHNFAKEGKELTADVNYTERSNSNISDYHSRYFDANGNAKPAVGAERATGGGTINFVTLQSDYTNPVNKNIKIETGVRVATRNYSSWNDNFLQEITTGQYNLIPGTKVNYTFTDRVMAAYGTYSEQIKNFSYQLGLRIENSKYEGNLLSKDFKFSNEYPFSLFPSVFLSQKLDKTQDLQVNYSRKINRPNFFQILPFVDFSDSLNLSVGNPDLLPEFTNLVELSYSNQIKPGHALLASLYGKNTNNLITRYQYRAPNTDITKPDSLIYNSYANANQSYTIGLELTAKNKLSKIWDITSNLNLFDVTLKAGNIANTTDNHLFSWFAKITNSFKLPKNYSIQVNADYQAKTILPANSGRGGGGGMGGGMYGQTQNIAQGFIKPIYGVDFSIRKDFLKNNAASLTLQVNDIFRTRTYETHANTAYFVQDNLSRRDPQVVRLNFNWRFGKFDVALIKRKNMKGESENMQNMQQ